MTPTKRYKITRTTVETTIVEGSGWDKDDKFTATDALCVAHRRLHGEWLPESIKMEIEDA